MTSPGAGSCSTEPFLHLDANGAAYAAADDITTTDDTAVTGGDVTPLDYGGDDDDEAPPPYSSAPGWRLTYVDFTPKCLDTGGILTSPKFESFE